MNWSDYSRFVGDVFGAPLAIEGLLAFFLESTFLGLGIFGWDRLSPRIHVACIWLVLANYDRKASTKAMYATVARHLIIGSKLGATPMHRVRPSTVDDGWPSSAVRV